MLSKEVSMYVKEVIVRLKTDIIYPVDMMVMSNCFKLDNSTAFL